MRWNNDMCQLSTMGYIMRHHQELKKTNLKESLSTVNRYVWFLLGRADWMCVIVADYRSRAVWCEWVRHEAREHELLTSTSLTETEETGAEQMVSGHWCRDWVTLICGHHSNNLVPPSMWDNMRANSDSESVFVQVRVPVFEDVMKMMFLWSTERTKRVSRYLFKFLESG